MIAPKPGFIPELEPMSTAQLSFDPYAKWLGISESARPLNPYQFLNVPAAETDWGKIRRAIDRQRLALDTCRADAEPDLWMQIKNELEAAIAALHIPEQKAVLDATLRRRSLFGNPAAAAGPPAEIPQGLTISCPGCKKENPGQRRFCAQCGGSLWDRCAKCGTEVTADEKFCGKCGSDVRGVLNTQQQELEDKLDAARRMAADLQFDQAIALLRQVACIEDPKLDRWAEQALDLIGRFEVEKSDTIMKADRNFRRAKLHVQNHAYENSLVLLEEVPAIFRTPEMEELRKQSLAARNEILALGGEIREAVERKRVTGLLPKIERLLHLKPNYTKAHELAGQVRDKLVKKAQKELATHEFQMAIDTLQQLPTFVRNEEIESLAEKAEELNTLLQDLRRAPLATETALAVGKRLMKINPTNDAAADLVAELEKKLPEKPKNKRLAAVDFAARPAHTAVDVPVDWLGYFTRMQAEDAKIAGTLEKNPGQFFVALGLALQGIDRAKIQVDLTSKPKTSMLGMLSSPLFKKKPKIAWGIDCSASGLKAIRLTADDKGEIKLTAAEFIPHQKLLTHPDAEVERSEIMTVTFKQFLGKHKLEGERVVASLPGQRVLGRFFDLPPMAAKKIPDAVQFEAKHQVPIPLEELLWDYEVQEDVTGKEADNHSRRVLLLAAREFHVKDRLKQLKDIGLNVDVLASDAVALHNAIVYEFFENEKFKHSKEGAILTADIGTDSSNIIVSSPNACWFRPVGLAGNDFTQALIKQFKLTYDQAEQLKQEPAKARRLSQLFDTLRPLFLQMTSEVERSITSHQKLSDAEPIVQVFGTGGGFRMHGLMRQLRGWG
jgi:type IV pilus assembly protein PilM